MCVFVGVQSASAQQMGENFGAWDGELVVVITSTMEAEQGVLTMIADGKVFVRDSRERLVQYEQKDVVAIFFGVDVTGGSAVRGEAQRLSGASAFGLGFGTGNVGRPGFGGASTRLDQTVSARAPFAGAEMAGVLITADGQRLRGRLASNDGTAAGEESIVWDGPPFGARMFAIEALRALRPGVGGLPVMDPAAKMDVIAFKNGDRAPTFIESIVADDLAEGGSGGGAGGGAGGAALPGANQNLPRQVQPGQLNQRVRVPNARGGRIVGDMRARGAMQGVTRGTIHAEVQGKSTEIPLERVQWIGFANPAARPARSPRLWLADSTVVSVGKVTLEVPGALIAARAGGASVQERAAQSAAANEAATRPGMANQFRVPTLVLVAEESVTGRVALRDCVAIAFDASAVVPLSASTVETSKFTLANEDGTGSSSSSSSSSSSNSWISPVWVDTAVHVPLDARDLVLPGPMTARFSLPSDATHIGGEVVLPASSRAYGSCRVTLWIDDVESGAAGATTKIGEGMLNAQSTSFRVAAALPATAKGKNDTDFARVLRVTLDPLEDGAIQDSAVLRRFLVKVAGK